MPINSIGWILVVEHRITLDEEIARKLA